VRIGVVREASAAPLLVAVAAGYFRSEGLDPKLVFFESDAAISAAVASGKVDFGLAALSPPFYSFAAAHELKSIASRSSDQTGFPLYALLVSGKARAAGLTGVRGLAHARIGTAGAETAANYALFSIAARFSLAFAAIKTVPLKSPAGEIRALARGEIDAALLPYPVALHAVSTGQSLLLPSNFTRWQQGVVFTGAATIAAKRDFVARFVRAYQRGTAEYHLNFLEYDDGGDFIPGPHYDDYLRMIARELHLSPDLLSRTKSYCDRRANLDAADIEKQVRFWQDRGRLDKRITAADLVDLSFIGEEIASPQPSVR